MFNMCVHLKRKCCYLLFLLYILSHNSIQVNCASKIRTYLRDGSNESNREEKDENVLAALEESEAGFDLNEAEMKKFHIWPSGIIPYFIDDFSYDKVLRDTIRAFLDHTSHLTGLRFVELLRPPEDGSRWVFFINRQGLMGCTDHPFDSYSNDGVQKVVLGYDCLKTEYGLAEIILSLVGVPPQHNAPNRDEFITIKRKNIMPEKMNLFNILRNDEWLFHDIDYDFKSAGHFDSHKFTINGGATIVPKDRTRYIDVGHGNCFSYDDIKKIKMLYNYISKPRSSARLPDCKKLFSPGSNFQKFKPTKEDDTPPRKRPNKYLGLKEDSQNADDKVESKEEGNKNGTSVAEDKIPVKSDEIVDEEENDDTTENTVQNEDHNKSNEPASSKEEEDRDDKNNDDDNINAAKDKSKPLKSKNDKKNKHQNLLELSDYKSGE